MVWIIGMLGADSAWLGVLLHSELSEAENQTQSQAMAAASVAGSAQKIAQRENFHSPQMDGCLSPQSNYKPFPEKISASLVSFCKNSPPSGLM
jgi:hypothetical protein